MFAKIFGGKNGCKESNDENKKKVNQKQYAASGAPNRRTVRPARAEERQDLKMVVASCIAGARVDTGEF